MEYIETGYASIFPPKVNGLRLNQTFFNTHYNATNKNTNLGGIFELQFYSLYFNYVKRNCYNNHVRRKFPLGRYSNLYF